MTQNPSSNQNPVNDTESDDGELDDENDIDDNIDDTPALAQDNIDDDSDDEDDDLQPAVNWTSFPIKDFQANSPRTSRPSDSPADSSTSTKLTTEQLLPSWKGYSSRGRGHFGRLNKQLLDDQNVGDSPLKFFMLFISDAVLMMFVVATNYFGKTYRSQYWDKNKPLDVTELKAFIAIILELGVIKFPNRDVAWEDSKHGNQFIRDLIWYGWH